MVEVLLRMKVLICFVALFAFVAANSQFAQDLREFNRNFSEFHYELTYGLRLQRLEVSEEIADSNSLSLGRAWDSVLAIRSSAQSARDAINERAQEIGNENQCLNALSTNLQQRENEAGERINRCAVLGERDYAHTLDIGFFYQLNYAQRMSSFTLVQTLWTIGLYNPFLEEDVIRYDLGNSWDTRYSLHFSEYFGTYRRGISEGLGTGNLNFQNCVLTASSLFNSFATSIRNDAPNC